MFDLEYNSGESELYSNHAKCYDIKLRLKQVVIRVMIIFRSFSSS